MKLWPKFRKWFPFGVSILYIIVFVYAAFSKLLDFETFRLQLSQSPMLTSFQEIIAFGIPSLEFILAIALSIKKTRNIALYISIGLMAAFSMYIMVILNFSDFVPCACGGILEHLGWTEHFIFNLIFVVLGCMAIFMNNNDIAKAHSPYLLPNKTNLFNNSPKKRTCIQISMVLILSSVLILGLFFYTNYKTHQPGSFIRLFPPHPLSEIKNKISLPKDDFQFAGITKSHVYLYKKGYPMTLIQLSDDFSKTDTLFLKIPAHYQLNIDRTEVSVNDQGIFITDGTKPILIKSAIKNWDPKVFNLKNNFFNSAQIIDSNHLAVIKLVPQKGRLLGILNIKNFTTHLNPLALETQTDSFFSTDGYLHYNSKLQKIIYSYYYRNEYVVMEKDLKVIARFKTIDTTSIAKIKLRITNSGDLRSLAIPPPIINRRSFSLDQWLFIQSKTRAKNEPQIRFKTGSDIDVYDLKTGDYLYSFYIPHVQGKALKDYRVKNNQLFVLYYNQLVRYEFTPDYLQSLLKRQLGQKNILHVESGM